MTSKQNNAHSELPWISTEDFRKPRIIGRDGRIIATLSSDFGPPDEHGVCKGLSHNSVMKNAAFIVEACNSYHADKALISELADSLAACVNLLHVWKGLTPLHSTANRNFESLPEIEAARAALSEAKEQQS